MTDMGNGKIERLVLGAVGTNCYLVSNRETGEAVIVDPADNGAYILEQCKKRGLSVKAVLLTHGHFDHMLAAPELKTALGVAVYAAQEDEKLMLDPRLNLSAVFGGPQASLRADVFVRDGEELELIGLRWRVIATPGHTPGSVCYYLAQEGALLAGDTLFCGSYGRTDFPGGSTGALVKSITEKLFCLPGETRVYPGHGEETTIGAERRGNPISCYC